jgi:hypothetical protein
MCGVIKPYKHHSQSVRPSPPLSQEAIPLYQAAKLTIVFISSRNLTVPVKKCILIHPRFWAKPVIQILGFCHVSRSIHQEEDLAMDVVG